MATSKQKWTVRSVAGGLAVTLLGVPVLLNFRVVDAALPGSMSAAAVDASLVKIKTVIAPSAPTQDFTEIVHGYDQLYEKQTALLRRMEEQRR